MTDSITPIVMPKWGLEMREGTIVEWLVREGDTLQRGQPLVDIETDKLANTYESPDAGLLRRIPARVGQTLPVKALLAVLAPPEVDDAAVDAYIASYQAPGDDADAQEQAPQFDQAEVQGIRVRYARRGDFPGSAAPVVFLHGFGGDLGNWQLNVDAAAQHGPVVLLDLPGHGQSEIKLPGTSLEAMAGFVDAFAQQLGIDHAHWVGHSMGAAVAAQLALDHPRRVRSLTLINPAGLGGDINAEYTRGFVQAQSRRELKPVLEMLFADPSLVSRSLVDDVLRYKRLDGVTEVLDALERGLFPQGRQAAMPASRLPSALPTLVIWGRQDRVIPVGHAQSAPLGARVELLDSAGHMAMLERAAEVNALLREHVRG